LLIITTNKSIYLFQILPAAWGGGGWQCRCDGWIASGAVET